MENENNKLPIQLQELQRRQRELDRKMALEAQQKSKKKSRVHKGRKVDKDVQKRMDRIYERRKLQKEIDAKNLKNIKKAQVKEIDKDELKIKVILRLLGMLLVVYIFAIGLKDTRTISQIINNGDEDLIQMDIITNGPINYVTIGSIKDTIEVSSKDIISQSMLVYSKTTELEYELTYYDLFNQECLLLKDYLDTQKGYDIRDYKDVKYIVFKGGTIYPDEVDSFGTDKTENEKIIDENFGKPDFSLNEGDTQ